MYLQQHQTLWTARAPAKLNLFLEVLDRRSDGFHEIETLMVPVRIEDSLGLSPIPAPADGSPGAIRLGVRRCFPPFAPPQGDVIPAADGNLVVRALRLLQERCGGRQGADVGLVKRIPVAAGLGGGSSDAAAALKLANRAWRLDWPLDRLIEVGVELGSDVPFFLAGGAAVCRGRGERVEKLPAFPAIHLVVVKPQAGLNTREVYEAHDRLGSSTPSEGNAVQVALATLVSSGRINCRAWMRNRLETAAVSVAPWLRKIRSAFDELDFLAHQLTGTGSAYFGVCRHAQHARRLATILRSRQLGLVYATRSCQ